MSLIDEKTKVPLFTMVSVLAIVITGAVTWGQTRAELSEAKEKIAQLDSKVESERAANGERDKRQVQTETILQSVAEMTREIRDDVKQLKRGGN